MNGKERRETKGMQGLLMIIILATSLLFIFAAGVSAVPGGSTITYGGGGAGQVVFDGTLHAAQGLACADCHEGHGLSFALFEERIEPGAISMRSMELGRSCGKCHPVSMERTLNCSICHHK